MGQRAFQADQDRAFNEGVDFTHGDEPDTQPCVTIAGCEIYTYVENGQLCVAIHVDEADKAIRVRTGNEEEVPLLVTCQDVVLYDSDPRRSTC